MADSPFSLELARRQAESPFSRELARRASEPPAPAENPFAAELARRQALKAQPQAANAAAPPAKDSPAVDFAKSLGSGLVRGATEIPLLPMTAKNLLEAGANKVFNAVEDTGRWAFGLPPASPEWAKARDARHEDNTQGAAAIRGARDAYLHEPQSPFGGYGRTLGEFVPAAVLGPGSSLVAKLAGAVIPAVASETAGQATKGMPIEPYARLAGGFVPNFAAAVIPAHAMAPTRAVISAAEGLKPADFDRAAALHARAKELGVPITGPEALGTPQLSDLQRLAEGSIAGGAKMAAFFKDRPQQIDAAVNRTLDAIAPPTTRPSEIAPAVNQVGVDAMQAAERMRTRASSPYYEAAKPEQINPNAVKAVLRQFDAAAGGDKTRILSAPIEKARSRFIDTPERPAFPAERVQVREAAANGPGIYHMTPAVPATPEVVINDIANLDRARKFLRDQTELPPFAADAIPKETGRAVGGVLNELRDRMERNSPNFRQGRQEHERISRNVVEPFAETPTGKLATATTPEAQAAIMFADNPRPGSAGQVGNAAQSIATRRPDVIGDFVRGQIERKYNAASVDRKGVPDHYAGAKFASALAGNDQQAKNLAAVLGAFPKGKQAQAQLDDLLNVFRAQGTRTPVGFVSELRGQTNKEFGTSHAMHAITSHGLSAVGPALSAFREQITRGAKAHNAGRLADVFVAPDAVERIRELTGRSLSAPYTDAAARSALQSGAELNRPRKERRSGR